jgi:hypothetical protein
MTKRFLGLTLLLLGLVALPMAAQAGGNGESITCGWNECVDIWNLVCNSTASKCYWAEVCDNCGYDCSDKLTATILFYSPTTSPLVGLSQVDQASSGGCATVQVCRESSGPSRALITVSLKKNDFTKYQIDAECRDVNETPTGNQTLTRVTNNAGDD